MPENKNCRIYILLTNCDANLQHARSVRQFFQSSENISSKFCSRLYKMSLQTILIRLILFLPSHGKKIYLHKQVLRQNYFTQKSAQIATKVNLQQNRVNMYFIKSIIKKRLPHIWRGNKYVINNKFSSF